jgi:hypothetical protein
MITIRLLPNLATSQPDSGMLNIDPVGSANKIPPSCASFSPSLVLISGIRLAQLAKLRPTIKKKQATATRWALFETARAVMAAKMPPKGHFGYICRWKSGNFGPEHSGIQLPTPISHPGLTKLKLCTVRKPVEN